MTAKREAFLRRVREAAAEGNRAGAIPGLPERGSLGYQGAGADPVTRFCEELNAAGGRAYPVASASMALAQVLELVRAAAPCRVLLGRGMVLDALPLVDRLRELGIEVTPVDQLEVESCRHPFFAADLGVSGADHLIAETGTVVLGASASEPRSLSLLPPLHIVVADRSQLLPDLFDLFVLHSAGAPPEARPLPSCLTLITGPSKTGDIELRLVTGVHGPGELHVVLIRD